MYINTYIYFISGPTATTAIETLENSLQKKYLYLATGPKVFRIVVVTGKHIVFGISRYIRV